MYAAKKLYNLISPKRGRLLEFKPSHVEPEKFCGSNIGQLHVDDNHVTMPTVWGLAILRYITRCTGENSKMNAK